MLNGSCAGAVKAKDYWYGCVPPLTGDYSDVLLFRAFQGGCAFNRPRQKHEVGNVLMVKITKDGRAVVVFRHRGDLKPLNLNELRKSEAQTIWGNGKISNGVLTFDLYSDMLKPGETGNYHLDTKLDGQRIIAYRLRGTGITKPEWTDTYPTEVMTGMGNFSLWQFTGDKP